MTDSYLSGGGVGAVLADKAEFMALVVPLAVLVVVLVVAGNLLGPTLPPRKLVVV